VAQHGQHHRVDLVGLAGQRREALDLLRVGDLDVPALLLERVVDEPSTGHRLDHGADRLCVNVVDSSRERSQRVEVRRDGELVEQFPVVIQKTDIDLASTEIQSGVQH
jgi:LytS/YehU family sensor histidine kinase